MKKLNELQVEKLYQFTRRHYVVYYDVQTELVDHLANGIEAQWQEDPEVDFEQALQIEFKKFGIYGFSDVVEKRERTMAKRYNRLIWKEILTVLKWPKMAIGLILIFGMSQLLLGLEHGKDVFLITLFTIFSIVLILVGRRAVKRKKTKQGKRIYLFEVLIENVGGYFSLLWVPFHFLQFLNPSDAGYVSWLMSFLITVVALTSYVCFFRLPKKKDEILRQMYPEMKFS